LQIPPHHRLHDFLRALRLTLPPSLPYLLRSFRGLQRPRLNHPVNPELKRKPRLDKPLRLHLRKEAAKRRQRFREVPSQRRPFVYPFRVGITRELLRHEFIEVEVVGLRRCIRLRLRQGGIPSQRVNHLQRGSLPGEHRGLYRRSISPGAPLQPPLLIHVRQRFPRHRIQ